ncbi:hypothetical protein PINS_up010781 [Pythium insidiosum]|nr:hypothetical protein PINS_up010781 [Pythium insidiosum]
MVKFKLSNASYRIRFLMFAAYGSGVEYLRLATPIQFDKEIVVGPEQLNFSDTEVSEYVTKWFKGIGCFERVLPSVKGCFCACLKELTGGHVGLCVTAIHTLNEIYVSHLRSGSDLPSPTEWIRMLQNGSLYQANDKALFEHLMSTRAVKVLNTLDKDALDRLERIAYGAIPESDTDIVERCLRKGILVQMEQSLTFSSPVMWRFFVKQRVGQFIRALDAPKTLAELIARVVRVIDFEHIRDTLGRRLSGGIPFQALQIEFYKAVYRSTPSNSRTSADVSAIFGSSGFIDFTIHEGNC